MGDDELDEAIKSCQAWAERLPILFPDKNLTRKGHSLSVHIPETLWSCRTYYMFYKAEQTGEAVHAAFNRLFQRWEICIQEAKNWTSVGYDERLRGFPWICNWYHCNEKEKESFRNIDLIKLILIQLCINLPLIIYWIMHAASQVKAGWEL